MKISRSVKAIAVFALLVSIVPYVSRLSSPKVAQAATGSITGTVYSDKNSNGINDGTDAGVGSVVVNAYDSTGTNVGTATTAANGSYTLNVTSAATTAVRVEFTTPSNYQPSFAGSGNATSIQFASVPATGVDYAVEQPGAYCANNNGDPLVATVCIRPGPSNGIAASVNTLTTTRWSTRNSKVARLTHSQTGATWGLAQDPGTGLVWTSAVLRRHAGLGPEGLGGVYVTTPIGGSVVASFDLATLQDQGGQNILLSSNAADYTDAARGLSNTTPISIDLAGYEGVGQVGLGDIDITPDGYLWATNLYEKTILRIKIEGTATSPILGAVTEYTVPQLSATTCNTAGTITNNIAHPWALEYDEVNAQMRVGIVCGRESNAVALSSPMQTGTGASAGAVGGAAIVNLNPSGSGSWTRVADVLINRQRWIEGCTDAVQRTMDQCKIMNWKGWTNNFTAIDGLNTTLAATQSNFAELPRYPQPIMGDIETLADGSFVVGFIDRFSMQMGANNIKPTETSVTLPWTGALVSGNVAGDLQLMCKTGASTWVQETSTAAGASPSKGGCVGVTTMGGNVFESVARPFSGTFDWYGNGSPFVLIDPTNQPDNNGYLEFFNDTVCGSTQLNGSTWESSLCNSAILQNHVEITQGGLVVWPTTGTQELASTSMDPNNKFDTGGVRWFDLTSGGANVGDAKWGLVMTETSNQTISTNTSFKKSSSMGDLEIICDKAPLQIGNYVWIDTDRDGIQDAGESPVPGVTVRLYNASGTLVGTAITDALGRYYFSSNVSEAANGGATPDSSGGGLVANATFTIKLDNNADFATGGPLVGYSMTNNDQTNAQSALDDSIDSDAVKVSWKPEISVAAHMPGVNDHTFDVGFNTTTAPVSLGNYVWYDENSDGLQTAGEAPAVGVTLTLTDLSGNPVIDVSGNVVGPTTTDVNGRYLFSNLHPGSYKVVITYPTGMRGTTANVGSDASVDSSTTTATSAMIPAGGQDLTLDFGLVPTNGWAAYNATTTTSSTAPSGSSSSSSTTTIGGGSETTSTTVVGSGTGTTSSTTSTSSTSSTSSTTTTSVPPATVASGGVSIGNYVWIDVNKNGIQDAGEPGISGVKLVVRDMAGMPVTDRAGNRVGPTYTDANGLYYFSNLPVGQYEVFISYPPGYSPTKAGSGTTSTDSSTDSAVSKTLPRSGMKDYTLDFGVVVSAVIEESVWVDANGDGLLTSGEKLVPGADVIILNPDGTPAKNLRGDPVTPVQTQTDGSFTFVDLAPGAYKVVVVYPVGYTSGSTGAKSVMFSTNAVVPPSAIAASKGTVAPTPTTPSQRPNARQITPVVSIGNLVWFDKNKDGFQSPTEKGISGASLVAFEADGRTRARDVNGRIVSPQRTSKSGRFLFANLPPGGYVVKIVYPAGYAATVAKSAGRARNSSTKQSRSSILAAGESDTTLDFGVVSAPIRRLPATL